MIWTTHDSRTVYRNRWIEVREDRITGPAGDGIYGVIAMQNPAVFVVALDEQQRVRLVTLERYTTGRSIEIPAGGSDGEDPLHAARRELREEAGLEADEWVELGSMNALNGVAVAPEHVFLARGPRPVEDTRDDRAEEGIDEVSWVPFDEVLRMIADGRITDNETIAALAFAGIHLGRFR